MIYTSNQGAVDRDNQGNIVMFVGKGGVGKTTCAATTALYSAAAGERTLAISTDATPSLSHIFEVSSKQKPVRVQGSLYLSELGAEEVNEMWDKKFGRDVYGVFSSFVDISYEEFVEFMTSILPGLSDEFMIDYIRELSLKGEYRTIVWDTAPLGQTLALLKTPALLGKHLRMAPRIYSKLRLGQSSREPILDILKRWEGLSAANMDFLRNEVKFNLVTIPEALAVAQLEGIFYELNQYDLKVHRLIINNVIKEDGSDFLLTKASQQRHYIRLINDEYPDIPVVELPMFSSEIKGLPRLREVEKILFSGAVSSTELVQKD